MVNLIESEDDMTGRVIADSICVEGVGVRISSKTVREHYDAFGQIEFKELIGYELTEKFPGAVKNAKVTYARESLTKD